MATRKVAERYLTIFALIAPLGLFVALLFEPLPGGLLILLGLGSGIFGLHILGRQGPLKRV